MNVSIFALSLIVLCTTAWAQPNYTVTYLGEFSPSDVNEQRQVIGRVSGRPAMWKDGTIMPMQHLGSAGTPVRWSDGVPGVSVGHVTNPSSPVGALIAAQWDASGALTLLYTRDQLHGSLANAQNPEGLTSGFGGRMDSIYGGPVSSAFRWDNPQSLTILDTQDGQWSESIGIDGQGNVWGLDKNYDSVVWDKSGRKSVIPGNPGRWTNIIAVNNRGVGVGHSTRELSDGTRESLPVQATIAQGFSLLPVLSAGAQCQPIDINNAGTTLGSCWMPDGSIVPILWEGGSIKPLSLEVPTNVKHLTLRGMNDQGVLVGAGSTIEDRLGGPPIARTHGFLFSPVYEPPSLALHLNRADFRPGERWEVLVEREGGPADLHVAIILPDGITTLFLTNLETLSYLVSTVDAGPYPVTAGASLAYTWHGLEPAGTYHIVAALARPGSLQDGRIDESDIVALDWKVLHVLPQMVSR